MFRPNGTFCNEIQKLTSTCNIQANATDLHKQLQTCNRQKMTGFESLMCLTNITQLPKFLDISLLPITIFSNWI